MSARKQVGGQLNASAYELLAQRHKPSDPARLAAEAIRLATDLGLTAGDISNCLRIDRTQVIQILSAQNTSKVFP